MEAVISVGDSFETFDQFRSKLDEYMRTTCTRYYRRDARTVTAARKRLTRPLNDGIKYYDIRYCCISDGFDVKSRRKRAPEAL